MEGVSALIGAVLAAGASGALGIWLKTRAERIPAFVTAQGEVLEAQAELIENLRNEVARLEESLRRRDERIDRQQTKINKLEERIAALEHDPPAHLG